MSLIKKLPGFVIGTAKTGYKITKTSSTVIIIAVLSYYLIESGVGTKILNITSEKALFIIKKVKRNLIKEDEYIIDLEELPFKIKIPVDQKKLKKIKKTIKNFGGIISLSKILKNKLFGKNKEFDPIDPIDPLVNYLMEESKERSTTDSFDLDLDDLKDIFND